eukprot:274203_1
MFAEIKLKLELKNIEFNHNELFQYRYEHVLLPLTQCLSFNAKLLKSETNIMDSHSDEIKENPRKLKKFIGFHAIPIVESIEMSHEEFKDNSEEMSDEVPCFISNNSTKMYRQRTSDINDMFIEYPVNCEYIRIVIEDVRFIFNKLEKYATFGDIYLTNFRLILKIDNNEEDLSQQIQFGCILKIQFDKNTLIIKVKDGRK